MYTDENTAMDIGHKVALALSEDPSADVGEIIRDTLDNIVGNVPEAETAATPESAPAEKRGQPFNTLSMEYLLNRIDAVLNNTEHIESTVAALVNQHIPNGVGDVANAAKADALGNIVKSREETNRRLLALYEKMYDDIKAGQAAPERAEPEQFRTQFGSVENIELLLDLIKHTNWDEYPQRLVESISEGLKIRISHI